MEVYANESMSPDIDVSATSSAFPKRQTTDTSLDDMLYMCASGVKMFFVLFQM